MKKALTLSIVIPVYNEEHHLKSCLESIAAQSLMPNEVLVVDNNSSDRSINIAKKFAFVRVIKEPRQGVIFARDTGFNAVKNDIIGRIDADTRLEPNWCQTVIDIFSAEPELSAITGPVGYYDMPLIEVGKKIDATVRSLVEIVQTTGFLFGTNMAIRRTAWLDEKDMVCHNSNIHEDLDLAVHLTKSGHEIAYKKELLASMSSRRLDDNPKNYHRYLKMNIKTYRAHGIETITPRMATSIYWLAYMTLKPLRSTYDEHERKLSIKRALSKRKPRKNPMADR